MVGSHAVSENARVIANDDVQMLLMPEILVALNFEREMGLSFEVTSSWHGVRLSSRPGFRFLELHTLWFEFIAHGGISQFPHLLTIFRRRSNALKSLLMTA